MTIGTSTQTMRPLTACLTGVALTLLTLPGCSSARKTHNLPTGILFDESGMVVATLPGTLIARKDPRTGLVEASGSWIAMTEQFEKNAQEQENQAQLRKIQEANHKIKNAVRYAASLGHPVHLFSKGGVRYYYEDSGIVADAIRDILRSTSLKELEEIHTPARVRSFEVTEEQGRSREKSQRTVYRQDLRRVNQGTLRRGLERY